MREVQDRRSLWIWWSLLGALAVLLRLRSTGLIEAGDGVQHYQIARAALHHPILLLDHWGKPLFTLLAMPFAQLGAWGVTLFNALCFVATCRLADDLLRPYGAFFRWAFAPVLLLAPAYGSMVLAGMTEVLFALMAVAVLWAFTTERTRTALVIASFMPYARPEAIAVLPFVAAWTLWTGRWRLLPYLVLGSAFYALIGTVVWSDPLWYIHRDPYYDASDTYGHGGPFHFLQGLPEVFGSPFLVVAALALLCLPWLWWFRQEQRPELLRIGVLAALPALAVLLLHSVLWWKGWKGSLGLLRVLVTVVPLVVLSVLVVLGSTATRIWTTSRGGWVAAIVGGLIYVRFAVMAFLAIRPVPVYADPYQAFLNTVGEALVKEKEKHQRVVFYHPYLAFRAELDPYDSTTAFHCRGLNMTPTDPGISEGDLLVWDAHFSPNEGRTPLKPLLEHPSVQLVGAFVPVENMDVLGGYPFEVLLFRNGPRHATEPQAWYVAPTGAGIDMGHRADTVACSTGRWCFGGNEFPLELSRFPLHEAGTVMTAIRVTGDLHWTEDPGDRAYLVFTEEMEGTKVSYRAVPMHEGAIDITFHAPARDPRTTSKLYIWNSSGHGFELRALRVEGQRFTTS